uniref:DNA-directed RNA polymerase subunit n=1 Tax=Ditylenchus dipsaci TaxID=166011 RepID=A0A915EJW8_9BILA
MNSSDHSASQPFMQFDKFVLRCYSQDEIRKLSILEINQTKTFDEAGFPIKNGLYDPALGCGEQRGNCETCGLKGLYCPGHFGHIPLTVPVFNPLLFSFTFNLMKGSCIHCHRFTCDTKNNSTNDFVTKLKELSQLHIKNDVAFKHVILKDFLRDVLFKRRLRCPHCKRANGKLRNDSGRAVLLDFVESIAATKKRSQEVKLAKKQELELKARALADHTDEPFMDVDQESKELKEKFDVSAMAQGSVILDPLLLSEKNLSQQLSHVLQNKCDKLVWRAAEVREHLRLLWQKEGDILKFLFPMFVEVEGGYPVDLLFCEAILVQPSKYRPIRFLHGDKMEHPITANLRKLLEADQLLTIIRLAMNSSSAGNLAAKELIEQKVYGKTMNEKLHNAYLALQMRANCLFDQEADKLSDTKLPALKQILEKKEGLFRMNMMGKRVNYACRSVITPDPYLNVDEIGIPELFARRLTFAEPTNYLNTSKLREIIRRGPLKHPGANFIQSSGGAKQLLTATKKENDRSAFALRIEPGKINNPNSMPTIVYRHLNKGDGLLMNRQPSLHKPSIMGHKARILKGQNALRMNRVAQAEIGELASVGNNYLVPKDGTPILGLIQDHVISGVLMTLRGSFFNKSDFMHLVFSAFAETTKRIEIPCPALIRPESRWSGKQIISAIMKHNIPADRPRINLVAKSKTSLACWKVPSHEGELDFKMSESQVIFRDGELLCGVLDKQHYGTTQFGLIHCCYELYGPKVAVGILSCFSRVFTTFLQFHGFTLGVADILVTAEANTTRRNAINEIRKSGPDVVKKTFSLPEDASALKMKHVMATAYNNPRKDKSDVKQLDYTMKQTMAKLSEQINNACVPKGLVRCFPQNALQLMIQSGAKGTLVNSIQISCALGQIELEGQRPPLSAVGRTLPSFRCFDPSPRAGGFIDQRFLTGLNPQELFFHTMAGREGLVDTAVKTSRSGYLQRCVIKHLEGLAVRYDNTVRDHDNSVVQFRYGEDGLDVGRATFLNPNQYFFLSENVKAVRSSAVPSDVSDSDWNVNRTEKQFRKCLRWKKFREFEARAANQYHHKLYNSPFVNFCNSQPALNSPKNLIKAWSGMTKSDRERYELDIADNPMSVDVKFNPATNLGAMSEKILLELTAFAETVEITPEFRRAIYWKGLKALADPGENVGLLAAQSIGEPSTQMTLNTFHFAGRGEMNVTLGIPRLREILMTTSKNISTPMTEIKILDGASEEMIEQLKCDMNPVYLKHLIKRFVLDERIVTIKNDANRFYELTIELLRNKDREKHSRHLSRRSVIAALENRFAREVGVNIAKRLKDIQTYQQIQHLRLRAGNVTAGGDDDSQEKNLREDGVSSDEEAGGAEYEGEDDEQGEVIEKEPNAVIDEMDEIMENSEDEQDESKQNDESMTEGQQSSIPIEQINHTRQKVIDPNRIAKVLGSNQQIVDYKYDCRGERWCVITYKVPLKNKSKLDIMAIIEGVVGRFVVSQVPGIEKCIVRDENKNGRQVKVVQTQGINVEALYKRADMLDVNSLYSNDIDMMLNTYGIEACGRTISTEMNNGWVFSADFGVYGIEVNPRHLSLTADYMTFTGQVQPFSRGAMAHSASTLQRMTFETTVAFMRDSIINGEDDDLFSPSARLVTGQLQRTGTGAFDLLADPRYIAGMDRHSSEAGDGPCNKKKK